jgi:uncharacterized protein (TIGR04255 family)
MPIHLEPVAALPHLRNAPLRLALVQVLFQPNLAIESAESVTDFDSALGDEWRLVDRGAAQQVQFEFGPAGVRHNALPLETVWRFARVDGHFNLALSPSSLGLDSDQYRPFDEFEAELARVAASFVDVFAGSVRTRLGVRYINEIEDARLDDPERLTFFLNRDLVRPVGAELGSDLLSSLNELRFVQPDGVFVLRHGLIESRKYLLDFDYFIESEGEFDADALLESARAFHSVIETVFCWSIGGDYLVELFRGSNGPQT